MSDNTAVVSTSTKENASAHEVQSSKKGSSHGSSTNASGGARSAELKGSSGNSIRPKPKTIGNYILGKV